MDVMMTYSFLCRARSESVSFVVVVVVVFVFVFVFFPRRIILITSTQLS